MASPPMTRHVRLLHVADGTLGQALGVEALLGQWNCWGTTSCDPRADALRLEPSAEGPWNDKLHWFSEI